MMEDLKKYLKVDEEKLNSNLKNGKMRYLTFISPDLQYWKKLFDLDHNKSELEKFLLYKMAGSFNLYSEFDDADITPPAIKYLIDQLMTIDSVVDVKVGKEIGALINDRVFKVFLNNNTDIYLETDTANSLQYDLGEFLRILLKKRDGVSWYNRYIEAYHLPENFKNEWYKPFKFYYFYSLIKNIDNEFKLNNEEKQCLKVLEERARYTHTLKNIVLVPYKYNCFRGTCKSELYQTQKKIKDRLDLTMQDLKSMLNDKEFHDKHFQKRINDKDGKATIHSIEFLLNNQTILFPKIPYYTPIMEDNTVTSIRLRSQIIIDILK